MEWETDRSLQTRMVLALVVLAVLPVAFTLTMTAALNAIVVPLAERLLAVRLDSVSVDLRLVGGLTLVGLVVAYLTGGRAALRSVGARRLDREAAPELHGRVERLARTAGVTPPDVAVVDSPVPNAFATGRSADDATVAVTERLARTAGVTPPDVAVVDSPVPNAFATGRSADDATVAVTEGLRERLDDDELDAVLAHEVAHVRNRDVAVMSVAYLLPTFTYVVSSLTYSALKLFLQGLSNMRTSGDDDGRALLAIVVLFVVTAIVTITVSAMFWAASSVLFRLLSQYREFAADRGAAALTGDPAALASALETIDDEMRALPDRDLRELDGGVEALYVSSLELPMFNDDDGDDTVLSQELLPGSHPPTRERVERLRELAGDLET